MPFGRHSEHLQIGCMISIIIIVITIMIIHPEEVGRQLCPECWLGESVGKPESQAVTWTQSSKEEEGAGPVLSLSLPWCPRGLTGTAWNQKTFPLWPITHGFDMTINLLSPSQSHPITPLAGGKRMSKVPTPVPLQTHSENHH